MTPNKVLSLVSCMMLGAFSPSLAQAETGVAIVSVKIREGQVRSIGAAAAVGDGTSLVGVSTLDNHLGGRPTLGDEPVTPCPCAEQSTRAFAINSDGDITLTGLTGDVSSTVLRSD